MDFLQNKRKLSKHNAATLNVPRIFSSKGVYKVFFKWNLE